MIFTKLCSLQNSHKLYATIPIGAKNVSATRLGLRPMTYRLPPEKESVALAVLGTRQAVARRLKTLPAQYLAPPYSYNLAPVCWRPPNFLFLNILREGLNKPRNVSRLLLHFKLRRVPGFMNSLSPNVHIRCDYGYSPTEYLSV